MTIRITLFVFLAFRMQAAHLVYQTAVSATLVATDLSGNAYVLGNSGIAKLDLNGNVVYSKALPAMGTVSAIAVDPSGNVFIAGNTNSDSLPATSGVFQPNRSPGVCITGNQAAQPYPCPDAFVAKIDTNGDLAWASYLGGLNIDQANGVAVDQAGNVYVSGFTLSSDFPVVNAFQSQFGGSSDAFVTKVSADGTRILYSSFLGGSGEDAADGIAVDSAENAYVVGEVQGYLSSLTSAGFGSGCNAGATSAFVAKVSPKGEQVLLGGCLGASLRYSEATAIAADQQGNIYIGGVTNDASGIATPGAFLNTSNSLFLDFVAKITADGSAVAYGAVFDGSSFGAYDIAVDANGSAYVSGPSSSGLPIAGPAMHPCIGGYFLLELNPAGSAALYSSFEEDARFAMAPDGSLILVGSSVERLSALATPGDSFLSAECVLNAASLESHVAYGQPGISPGEIVALKGTGLGPSDPPNPVVANGMLGNALGGTQVFFDGVPAPLMYVQDAQINAVAPYSLAGKTSVSIQVQYQAQNTASVTIPVSATSAALFEQSDSTPLVLNQDYSQNSQTSPVPRGGFLIIYMTGAGQTSPASVDGQIWQTGGGLQAAVSAQLTTYGSAGQVTAATPVVYAGPVPTLVSGVQQMNIQIPANLPDSFSTPAISVGSAITAQIGAQQLSFPVFVK
jgi:uncharacterized protein (TIGR03437 family)